MASPDQEPRKSVSINIIPTKISIKTEKKYKERKLKEIMNAYNGLCNSGGGLLKLQYDKEPPKKHIDDCIKIIEQKIIDVTGSVCVLATDVHQTTQSTADHTTQSTAGQTTQSTAGQTTRSTAGQTILSICGPTGRNLMTLNYHLYFPSDNQVNLVPPTEDVERIKRLLARERPSEQPTLPGSHEKHFVMDKEVAICESKTTQFKKVKEKPGKKTTVADRVLLNRFRCYVSAYANYCGGHIYYGINDDRVVEGEKITTKDRDKITREVTKAMNKMIWPENCAGKKGEQWDIHFESVKNSEDMNPIPSTFVIVIYIAQCPGGVFTEEPECYHIVGGNKLEKMSLADWKIRVSDPSCDTRKAKDVKPNTDQKSYRFVYQMLTKLLNNNCSWSELKQASESAMGSDDELGVKLIGLSKLVSFCYRKGEFSKATELLDEYKSVLEKSQASRVESQEKSQVFHVLERYLYCAMERCRGNNEESYRIAKDCLKNVDEIPSGIISAAFYGLVGTVATNLATQENNSNRSVMMIEEARTFFKKTEEHLHNVQEFPPTKADLQQKMYINQAMLELGCSLSGNITQQYDNFGDMNTAQDLLTKTQQIEIRDKYPLSKFREIQYDFALSCLYYRSSCEEKSPERQAELLKDALKFSKKAEKLAIDCELVEMKRYSRKRVDFFEEKLRQ